VTKAFCKKLVSTSFLGTSAVALAIGTSCAPKSHNSPDSPGAPKEVRLTDPALQDLKLKAASTIKRIGVVGNVWIETQDDITTGGRKLFLKAVFHEPLDSNLFLDSVLPLPVVAEHRHGKGAHEDQAQKSEHSHGKDVGPDHDDDHDHNDAQSHPPTPDTSRGELP
jgi:hypothetical protein